MTRDTAENVIKALLSAVREVNDNLFLVKPEIPEAMYEEYKKRSGEVMAAIYLDLIKPNALNSSSIGPFQRISKTS